MQDILEKVKEFADRAHGKQTRKYTPERYIVHPVRVMELVAKYTNETPLLAAALLHDVLEDTKTTVEEIRTFLTPIMEATDVDKTVRFTIELTDVYTKTNYPRLNRRQRKSNELERLRIISPESQTIKYADIFDNAAEIVSQDPDFANVFLREAKVILKKIDKGNQELYRKVCSLVDELLNQLERKERETDNSG